MIVIASLTYDLDGVVTINEAPETDYGDIRRRVNRASTLDGGAVFQDQGFTHADRTMTVIWRPVSKAHNESVARLVRLYARLRLSTREGAFIVAPEFFNEGPDENTLFLFVVEKEE